jgi:glycogen operon protein
MTDERWGFSEGRLLALRRVTYQPANGHDKEHDKGHGKGHDGRLAASLLLLNAFSEDREFVLPPPAMPWRVAVDAAEPIPGSDLKHASPRQPEHNKVVVAAHSALLLTADDVLL